jgi:hypothetical protein
MPDEANADTDGIDLADPDVVRLLDRVTQLALSVASVGAAATPPIEAPAALRPLLRHRKTTSASRSTIRRVLHEDAGFRDRVGAALPADDASAGDVVGPAGVLFVRRPDRWTAAFAALVDEARRGRTASDEVAHERRASRKLRSVEERVAALEAAAATARADAEQARLDAQESRRAARAATDQATAAAQRLHAAEARAMESDAAVVEHRAARGRMEGDLQAAIAEAATRREEVAALQAEVAGLRAALRDALASPTAAAAPTAPAPLPLPDDAAGAISAAAHAAASLGRALERAAAALADERDEAPLEDRPRADVSRPRRTSRRRPAPLPPLVLEGSDEEADHLVRLDGLTLLVDGYNTTLATWPELDLPAQRRRLVDLLAGVAARFGPKVEIVFDGADVVDVPVPAPARPLVRIDFTAPDVEADDVLIERARERPLPVLVVSDDHRVRDGARRGGANVLTVAQLLGAARRG